MKKLLTAIIFLIVSFSAEGKEIDLSNIDTASLQKIYDFYGYDEYLPVPSYKLPAIFLKKFPADYNKITDEAQRNILFIKILSPLALKLNREINAEREQILPLYDSYINQNKPLNKKQKDFIEKKAQEYDLFSRLKEDERYKYLLRELYRRIDIVPPSFLIAAAAIETNWGTNRLVSEGNVLYKERVWHTNEGLKPKDDPDDYRYRVFPSLFDAMVSFAHKINTDINFDHFRHLREEIRYRENPITGTETAFSLFLNTPIKNYAGLLEYTIAYYELNIIDKSELDVTITNKKLENPLAKFAK